MQTHPQSKQGCNPHSQDGFTSVNSVNPITVSVAPPQTWLCTFLRSKNQGNQVLSHLVTAAFRFPGMYWAQSWAEPWDAAHSGDALCKIQRDGHRGKRGQKRGRIVSNIKDCKNLLQNLDTCREKKPLVIAKSREQIQELLQWEFILNSKWGRMEKGICETHRTQNNRVTNSQNW